MRVPDTHGKAVKFRDNRESSGQIEHGTCLGITPKSRVLEYSNETSKWCGSSRSLSPYRRLYLKP